MQPGVAAALGDRFRAALVQRAELDAAHGPGGLEGAHDPEHAVPPRVHQSQRDGDRYRERALKRQGGARGAAPSAVSSGAAGGEPAGREEGCRSAPSPAQAGAPAAPVAWGAWAQPMQHPQAQADQAPSPEHDDGHHPQRSHAGLPGRVSPHPGCGLPAEAVVTGQHRRPRLRRGLAGTPAPRDLPADPGWPGGCHPGPAGLKPPLRAHECSLAPSAPGLTPAGPGWRRATCQPRWG